MNDKSRMILKMLAGGYILYIGISLLIGVLQTEPNEKVLMIIVSIFFMAVGGTVLYLSVGALLKEYGVDIEFWKQKNEKIRGERGNRTDGQKNVGGEIQISISRISQKVPKRNRINRKTWNRRRNLSKKRRLCRKRNLKKHHRTRLRKTI